MIHFAGQETFPLARSVVQAKLSDAAFLVRSLKNVDEILLASPDESAWKLRPGFSFVRGTLETRLTIQERRIDETLFRVVGKGIGASSTVTATLRFVGTDSSTVVEWTADLIELTGLLKMVPKGLISSAAGKVIAEVWDGIRAQLAP